jgi:DNA-binding NtrC family response regulator
MQASIPPRVLVVDDEPLIRWSIAETLGDSGYEVVNSGDAESACDAVRQASSPFDVILLDLRLPDSADLSLLRAIRRMAPTTRVILMTAFGTQEVIDGALDLGAYRVMDKPFEIQEMVRLVDQASARH